jgi:hypothetical protein
MQNNQSLTRQEWFNLVDEFQQSGLTQANFCKQKNISLCRFGYYVKKSRDKDKNLSTSTKAPSFSEINVQSVISNNVNDFTIELINGFKCKVPVNIHPDQLKIIVRTLLSC